MQKSDTCRNCLEQDSAQAQGLPSGWGYAVNSIVPAQSQQYASSTKSGLSGGAIAGIVIGCLAFLVLLCAIAALVIFRARSSQRDINVVMQQPGA